MATQQYIIPMLNSTALLCLLLRQDLGRQTWIGRDACYDD